MRPALLVAPVVSALLLAACGSGTEVDLGAPQASGRAGATCPDPAAIESAELLAGEEAKEPLPADVAPTGILLCDVDIRDVPGDGRWTVLVASWADTHLETFVSALREPDEIPSDGACPLNYIASPWFALVTADGRVVHARLPVTSCHQPQQAALDAFAALPFTVVKETRLSQVETAKAQATGCSQQWKDMVAITANDGRPSTAAKPVLSGEAAAKVRVCLYATDGTPPDQTPGGDFVSGRVLKGRALETAFADLEAAPAARPCTTRATMFAVLMPEGGDVLTVETDGCGRMLTEAGELRAAPAALLAALR